MFLGKHEVHDPPTHCGWNVVPVGDESRLGRIVAASQGTQP